MAPKLRLGWRFRAATLVHLGRINEARDAVAVLRTLTPVQTLRELSERAKYSHHWMKELYFDALAKAGYE
jgi:hypothetical protein